LLHEEWAGLSDREDHQSERRAYTTMALSRPQVTITLPCVRCTQVLNIRRNFLSWFQLKGLLPVHIVRVEVSKYVKL